MSSYLVHFMVYALAMVGVIAVCILVFKKSMTGGRFAKNNNELCIENALNLSQRKTLYVIKAGEEKFLIAADLERTSLIAKLGEGETVQKPSEYNIENAIPQKEETKPKTKAIDYSEVTAALNGGKKPVFREMMKKLNKV